MTGFIGGTFAAFLFAGLASTHCVAKPLEAREVSKLQVTEIDKDSKQCFKITGLIFDSALGVRAVKQVLSGDDLYITANLALANGKYPGSLDYEVCPDRPVKHIYLGKSRQLIWSSANP